MLTNERQPLCSNVWCNASGPNVAGTGWNASAPDGQPATSPGKERPAWVADNLVAGVSAGVVRNGYDLLRRLGRLDLARHYPHLGVSDVCSPGA